MSPWAAAAWGALAAASLLAGGWLAVHARPSSHLTGLVMAFGAGALIGAVAYELVPKGIEPDVWSFAALGAGAAVFYTADLIITGRHRSGSAGKAIALGALLDAVPESLVLGMSIAAGGTVSVAFLAAVFLSNLPEALGATASLTREGHTPARVQRMWAGVVVVSALCAAAGYGLLRLLPGTDGSLVEAFAAGAVLTMLANSMMPEALREGGRLAGPITVAGFAAAAALTMLE